MDRVFLLALLQYRTCKLPSEPVQFHVTVLKPRPVTPLLQVSLSVKLVQHLRDLAQRCGSSLFVTVLAAFKVLLLRYSGREDLCVGTPSAGRGRPDLQGNLVGCFVNLTMLRTSLAGKLHAISGTCIFKDMQFQVEEVSQASCFISLSSYALYVRQ